MAAQFPSWSPGRARSPKGTSVSALRSFISASALACVVLSGCVPKPAVDTPVRGCTEEGIRRILDKELSTVSGHSNVPGITASVYVPLKLLEPVGVAHGWADYERQTPMTPESPMLAGSVGKTFYAAAALRLVDLGRLDLDQTIDRYVPSLGIPNADRVTLRMLLSHRSGYGEYDGVFMEDLIQHPERVRDAADWLGPLRRTLPAEPGSFRYSDINFVILALVIDQVAGESAVAFIESNFLTLYRLHHTGASDRPEIPGLVQGYAGPESLFGQDEMVQSGRLIYNPQFESGGGGYVSTSTDLARWITLFATSTLFSEARWREATTVTHHDSTDGTHAYGLGIHVDSTAADVAYGHSGYIPGYVSWVRWYAAPSIAVAIQTNTSDPARLEWDGFDVSDRLVRSIAAVCSH